MWIQTYTGRRFDFDNITPESICIEDIAHALALTNRFCGHTSEPYSVAQHSVIVSRNLPREIALEGLLHDAHEAYIHDITAPLKVYLGDSLDLFDTLETQIKDAIDEKFGLRWQDWHYVKAADMRALAAERRDLFGGKGFDHDWGLSAIEPFESVIKPWPWQQAKRAFLGTYGELRRG
jgi:5'-deoxynucleotidase YfbR-like HD superfamily hydrolase